MNNRRNFLYDTIDLNYGFNSWISFANRTKDNLSFIQRLKIIDRHDVHNGCVNTICWNEAGDYILSGSDDQHLVVFNPFTGKTEVSLQTAHSSNIFSAKFLPNTEDKQVVSCSADGMIHYNDFDRRDLSCSFNRHVGAVYEIVTVPSDSNSFLSCGEDGSVRWFDLRVKNKCNKENCKEDVIINCRRSVMSLAVNPVLPYQIALGCSDSTVRIYDRRMLSTRTSASDSGSRESLLHHFKSSTLGERHHRITSLSYSSDGKELLVSYSSEYLYLFDFKEDGKNPKQFLKSAPEMEAESRAGCISREVKMATSSATSSSTSMSSAASSSDKSSSSPRHQPIKRLRLRGDWSDTGPDARPENERDTNIQEPAQSVSTMMQRMSNLLTRWMERNTRRANENRSQGMHVEEMEDEDVRPGGETGSPRNIDGQPGPSVPMDEEQARLISFKDIHVPDPTSCHTEDDQPPCIAGSHGAPCDLKDDQAPCVAEGADRIPCAKDRAPCGPEDVELPRVVADQAPCVIEVVQASCKAGTDEAPCAIRNEQALCSARHEDQRLFDDKFSNVETISKEVSFTNYSQTSATFEEGNNQKPSVVCPFENADVGNQSGHLVKLNINSRPEKDKNVDPPVFDQSHSIDQTCDVDPPVIDHSRSIDQTCDVDQPMIDRSHSVDQTYDVDPLVIDQSCSIDQTCDVDPPVIDQSRSIDQTCDTPSAMDDLDINTRSISSEKNEPQHLSSTPGTHQTNHDERVFNLSDSLAEVLVSDAAGQPSRASSTQRSHRPRFLSDEGRNLDERVSMETMSASHKDDMEISDTTFDSRAVSDVDKRVGTSEQNRAATKLQAIFRKRNEMKRLNDEYIKTLPQPSLKQCYRGHRNSRTMIKEAAFWGNNYVMSGSDCGHIFVWDRETAKLVMLLEGDRHVVNCLQPHPFCPVLASSGIDYDVKIWMPANEQPNFDHLRAQEVMKRNEIMLEETRDTVTVPASFMLRMLASLNYFRRGNQNSPESGSSRSTMRRSSEDSHDD